MVGFTPSRLLRQTAIAAVSATVLAAPVAHAAPWNAVAFTAWQFGSDAQTNCTAIASETPALAAPMSALDRIRMQQAGVVADADASSNAARRPAIAMAGPRRKLEPAAAGIGCAPIAPANEFSIPPRSRIAAGRGGMAGDFLASKIVPIDRTGFDAQWARVSTRSAGKAQVRAARLSTGEANSPRERIAAVNRWVNARVTFTEDSRNYGQRDYWADAAETLRRGKGDCEDYAIVKMQILAEMGIAREDMYLTLARDNIRRIDHAVLVVKLDGQPLVLDNGSDLLLDGSVSNDFRPVYSFSGNRRYLHGF